MTIRRRITDDDWAGAHQREPWAGPTSQWGEDVNMRLDAMELMQKELIEHVRKNNELGDEILALFRKSKRLGLGLVAVLAFLGYSGLVAIWDWLQKHIR